MHEEKEVMQPLSRICQLLNHHNFLLLFYNQAIKTPSSLSDNADDVKFLVQYFRHPKKGKV